MNMTNKSLWLTDKITLSDLSANWMILPLDNTAYQMLSPVCDIDFG